MAQLGVEPARFSIDVQLVYISCTISISISPRTTLSKIWTADWRSHGNIKRGLPSLIFPCTVNPRIIFSTWNTIRVAWTFLKRYNVNTKTNPPFYVIKTWRNKRFERTHESVWNHPSMSFLWHLLKQRINQFIVFIVSYRIHSKSSWNYFVCHSLNTTIKNLFLNCVCFQNFNHANMQFPGLIDL